MKRATAACCCACAITASAADPVPFVIAGDAIDAPLGGLIGDAARGRAIVANRQVGLCILCHQAPLPEVAFQGDLATNLAGVGARWSPAQLRLRMVDARKLNPQSIMPSYYRVDDLNRVSAPFRAKTILSAQQIEDVVAYLVTLR
jgi:L-cysteine S-thiosulfotransferase